MAEAFEDDAGARRPVVPYVISLLKKEFGRVAEKEMLPMQPVTSRRLTPTSPISSGTSASGQCPRLKTVSPASRNGIVSFTRYIGEERASGA